MSEYWFRGDLYITPVALTDIELTGQAHFAVNRDQLYIEGDLDGYINIAGVSAEGRLEWHIGGDLGGDAYQSIQGRLIVAVLTIVAEGKAEGGFYIGMNAPKTNAWVLHDMDSRFALEMRPLPDRLTGFYGYAKIKDSINLYIISGGIEMYAGLGAFINTGSTASLESGLPGLPYVIGNLGLHIWGEILGGLVSAGAWADLQIIAPLPFSFQGNVGLEGCVLWFICGSVDLVCGLNSSEGFYVR